MEEISQRAPAARTLRQIFTDGEYMAELDNHQNRADVSGLDGLTAAE